MSHCGFIKIDANRYICSYSVVEVNGSYQDGKIDVMTTGGKLYLNDTAESFMEKIYNARAENEGR